jgi:hypothetical protein
MEEGSVARHPDCGRREHLVAALYLPFAYANGIGEVVVLFF